eukprot:298228-Hanusia_phi.AAC.3
MAASTEESDGQSHNSRCDRLGHSPSCPMQMYRHLWWRSPSSVSPKSSHQQTAKLSTESNAVLLATSRISPQLPLGSIRQSLLAPCNHEVFLATPTLSLLKLDIASISAKKVLRDAFFKSRHSRAVSCFATGCLARAARPRSEIFRKASKSSKERVTWYLIFI